MVLHILLIFSLITVMGCTGISSESKATAIQTQRVNLNQQYVGYSKDAFKNAYGDPRRIFKRKTAYFINSQCSHWGCPRESADEMWSYLVGQVFATGKKYYSVYVYFKNDHVVHIR